MIQWAYFPQSDKPIQEINNLVDIFKLHNQSIDSNIHTHKSDEVLAIVENSLEDINYTVEKSKKAIDKITIPVLFGMNGKIEKYFDADAYNSDIKLVLEVEAGRAVTNYQFLKDLFQACMMQDVDYLGIAVRNTYGKNNQKDFEKVFSFFDTLYKSNRLKLPLKGVVIIGY